MPDTFWRRVSALVADLREAHDKFIKVVVQDSDTFEHDEGCPGGEEPRDDCAACRAIGPHEDEEYALNDLERVLGETEETHKHLRPESLAWISTADSCPPITDEAQGWSDEVLTLNADNVQQIMRIKVHADDPIGDHLWWHQGGVWVEPVSGARVLRTWASQESRERSVLYWQPLPGGLEVIRAAHGGVLPDEAGVMSEHPIVTEVREAHADVDEGIKQEIEADSDEAEELFEAVQEYAREEHGSTF